MVLCPHGQGNRYYVRGKVSGRDTFDTETSPLQVLSREESGCRYSFCLNPKPYNPGKTAAYPLQAGAYGYSRQESHQIRVKNLPVLLCIYYAPEPSSGSGRILCAGTGRGYCEESLTAGAFFSLTEQTMTGDYLSGPPGNTLKCCLGEIFLQN